MNELVELINEAKSIIPALLLARGPFSYKEILDGLHVATHSDFRDFVWEERGNRERRYCLSRALHLLRQEGAVGFNVGE